MTQTVRLDADGPVTHVVLDDPDNGNGTRAEP